MARRTHEPEQRTSRERLDNALVSRGICSSRSRAGDLIRRGFIEVDGAVERKAGRLVGARACVRLSDAAPNHVSRGGEKLAAALDHFGYPVEGLRLLDIGASTGGFTQVLLERGAREVAAVDVGRDQLHPSLRADRRVHNLEQTDARDLDAARIGGLVDAMVADVSFISLEKALPAALGLVASDGWMIVLVKPQFEAGREHIGGDGVVRDPKVHDAVIARVSDWLSGRGGWRVDGFVASPIEGGSGNREFLMGARRHG